MVWLFYGMETFEYVGIDITTDVFVADKYYICYMLLYIYSSAVGRKAELLRIGYMDVSCYLEHLGQ